MPGNLLVVDDELDVLDGLVELYETELDDVTVYKANNARKALAFLQIARFDVVVTDINMPGMNGLELFKKIRQGWPKCQIIFLTGYREFDYLYEINKHKDVQFMLKSESDETLVSTVKKAFENVERMLNEKVAEDIIAELDKINSSHLNYHKERVVSYLKDDNLSDKTVLYKFAEVFNFQDKFPFIIFLLHLDEGTKSPIWSMEKEITLLVEEFFPVSFEYSLLFIDDNYCLIVVQAKVYDEFQEYSDYINLVGAMNYLQEKLNSAYQISSSIISSNNIYLDDLLAEYHELMRLSFRYLRNQKQIFIRKEAIEVEKVVNVDVNKELYQLSMSIESSQIELFDKAMDRIFDIIMTHNLEGEVKEIYQGSMAILLNFMIKKQIIKNDSELFFPYSSRISAIRSLLERVRKINTVEQNLEVKRNEEIIQRITEYIRHNIDGNLSLDEIAKYCYLNPSYLSRIFKQSTGQNLSDYVSRYRIETAKKLLLTTQLKINEIAEKIGYQTPHSFTRLFKKYEEITPIEYRDRFGHHAK